MFTVAKDIDRATGGNPLDPTFFSKVPSITGGAGGSALGGQVDGSDFFGGDLIVNRGPDPVQTLAPLLFVGVVAWLALRK